MCLDIRGVDEDVVEVYNDEVVEAIIEESMHRGLKGAGGIGESEWHDEEFECTIAGCKSGFVFVAGSDGDLVVARVEVEFSKVAGVAQVVV